jgi:hypothetical protein
MPEPVESVAAVQAARILQTQPVAQEWQNQAAAVAAVEILQPEPVEPE